MSEPPVSDQYSLTQQRAVLLARRKAIEQNGGTDRDKIDQRHLEMLRDFSPLRLARCLIERNQVFWMAAYLIQRIGQEGYRYLLLLEDDWKIMRSRKSARVIEVPPTRVPIFEDLVKVQRQYVAGINYLLGRDRLSKQRKRKRRKQERKSVPQAKRAGKGTEPEG